MHKTFHFKSTCRIFFFEITLFILSHMVSPLDCKNSCFSSLSLKCPQWWRARRNSCFRRLSVPKKDAEDWTTEWLKWSNAFNNNIPSLSSSWIWTGWMKYNKRMVLWPRSTHVHQHVLFRCYLVLCKVEWHRK